MSKNEESLVNEERDMVLKLVKWYVSEGQRKKSSNGEYASVDSQDFLELSSIIEGIIALRCEPNSAGEYPIEFRLVNLLEEEPLKFTPVPLEGKSRKMVMLANLAKAAEKISEIRNLELASFTVTVPELDEVGQKNIKRRKSLQALRLQVQTLDERIEKLIVSIALKAELNKKLNSGSENPEVAELENLKQQKKVLYKKMEDHE